MRGSFGFKAENAPRAYLTGGAKFKVNSKNYTRVYACFSFDFLIIFHCNFLLHMVFTRLTVHF